MGEKNKDLKQASKRGLKVMNKNKARHPVRKEGRIMKYGAKVSLGTSGCRQPQQS